MLTQTFFAALTALIFLASVQAKTDCEVLNAGFPAIPAVGCCGYEADDANNGWVNKTNLGIYCDVRSAPTSSVPVGRIRKIKLNSQGLEGHIPEDIGLLSYLDWFSLLENNVVGEIPESICDLPVLRVFYLSTNQITGTVPKCIPKMPLLVSLDFADTLLRGHLPPTLGDTPALKSVFLSFKDLGHRFSGVLPNMDSALKLTSLYLYEREGTDKYPLIGQFPNITDMPNFSYCTVIPSHLCRHPDIDVKIYKDKGCNADQLPICTLQDYVNINEAHRRAADPVLSAQDDAALIASYAQDILDEQAVIDAEAARLAALVQLELDADAAAQARIDAAEAEAAAEAARLLAIEEGGATSSARPSFTPAILAAVLLVLVAF